MLAFLKTIKSEAAVGLLIISSSGLLVYSSIQVTGWSSDTVETYNVHTLLDNTTGLSVGTAVRLAGIKIGEIQDIALDSGKARVTMKIFQKYPLRTDSQIAVKSLGILGDKYVEVTVGSPGADKLNDGEEIIIVQRGSDLDSMIDSLAGILSDFKQVTYALRESMGGDVGADKFNEILANLNGFLDKLNKITEENQKGVKSMIDNLDKFSGNLNEIAEKNKSELKAIITNIEQITASLRTDLPEITASLREDVPEITGNLRALLEDNRERLDNIIKNIESSTLVLNKDLPSITSSLRESFAKLEESTEKLDNSLGSVESITEKIDTGQGTFGRLVNEEDTVDKLNKALDDLGGFLGDAQKLKFDIDFRSEYMNQYEEFKSYLGLELFPYRDHSFLIELVDDPRGKSETETKEKITTNNDGSTSTTTEKTTTYTDTFKFSLMITQRYFDTRFRAGLFESSFGLGVDQFFGVNDNFKTYIEAFDFNNENDNIHYKLGASWRFLGNFYLTLGADNFAARDDRNKNYFIGLGLGFNEDSLKTLAVAAGGASAISQ